LIVQLASLEIRMARSENLPVLPQAVGEIMRLADDPNANQREMEKAFEQDPAMTAKILKVANSAYYGGANVPTIGRAISFLGMSAIRSMVVGISFQQMSMNRSESRHFDKLVFWQNSLATAIGSRVLAKLKVPAKGEELYCAGMMHDIGILIFERFVPKELDEAIELSNRSGKSLPDAEKEVLGFDHTEVGGILAQKWALNDLMRNAIRYHLDPKSDSSYFETTQVVGWANQIAGLCGFPGHGVAKVPSEAELAASIGLPPEQMPIIRQVVTQEIEKIQSSFSIAA
jgi:HD-like signal output (HDOD) protein